MYFFKKVNMNKVFLVGKIIEKSDYKFFYNSRNHNSRITLKIETLTSNYQKGTIIEINFYDNVADKIYRFSKIGDSAFVEGRLINNMEIEGVEMELL